MFLVQISEIKFIDADKIECVWFSEAGNQVYAGIGDSYHAVENDFSPIFLSNLCSLDEGVTQPDVKLGKLIGINLGGEGDVCGAGEGKFDITKSEVVDYGYVGVKLDKNLYVKKSGFTIDKSRSIEIAKHFGLTAEDLK